MRAAAQTLGDPLDPNVALGPLVDTAALERVKAMIARGREEAELVVGGNQSGEEGCFMEPTVFLNPKPDAQILRDEVFGPVSVVVTFRTEQEAIDLANDTEFGLMAGVFTRDLNRALRVSAKIDSGVVGVNCVTVVSISSPSPKELNETKQGGLIDTLPDELAGSLRRQETIRIRQRDGRIRE